MDEAHKRAVRLLRGHLSPEQLADYDQPRKPPGTWGMPPAVARHFRWFNVTGSRGGEYTICGAVPPHHDPNWGASIGYGHDRPRTDWCVHVYGYIPDVGRRWAERIPVADQMLAYKLAIETDEVTFLARAAPITTDSTRMVNELHEEIFNARYAGVF